MKYKKCSRPLLVGGVGLIEGAGSRHSGSVSTQVRDEMERLMIEDGYLDGAPFSCISLILEFGRISAVRPRIKRINKSYGDLPVNIEVDSTAWDEDDRQTVYSSFRKAILITLVAVGKQYDRPMDRLSGLLTEISK